MCIYGSAQENCDLSSKRLVCYCSRLELAELLLQHTASPFFKGTPKLDERRASLRRLAKNLSTCWAAGLAAPITRDRSALLVKPDTALTLDSWLHPFLPSLVCTDESRKTARSRKNIMKVSFEHSEQDRIRSQEVLTKLDRARRDREPQPGFLWPAQLSFGKVCSEPDGPL